MGGKRKRYSVEETRKGGRDRSGCIALGVG